MTTQIFDKAKWGYYEDQNFVRENENFRFESRYEESFTLRSKKLKDVIESDEFAFEGKMLFFSDGIKLKPNDHKIDVIRWNKNWKTIRLIYLDGQIKQLNL